MKKSIAILFVLIIHILFAKAEVNCFSWKTEFSNGKSFCGIVCNGEEFNMSCDSDLMKEIFP